MLYMKDGMWFYNGQRILHSYIRDSHKKIGVIIAFYLNGEIKYGYSVQHPLDRKLPLNKEKTLKIAFDRAIVRNDIQYPFDHLRPHIAWALLMIYNRANKYFKYLNVSRHWYKGWHDGEDWRTFCHAERDNVRAIK